MRIHPIPALAVATSLCGPSLAVAAEVPKTAMVFATYYRCTEATEDRADAIFKDVMAPLWKKEADGGRIGAYGWSKHWAGGDWRRLEYIIGTDLDKMIDARDATINKLMAEHPKELAEFSSICSGHDDYLWASGASSQAPEVLARERGAVGLSTYFQCDAHEDEADAIVKSAVAPVLNQHVQEGKITSWNWLQHRIGGKYRRAIVVDGPDHKSMVKYWGVLGQALDAAQPRLWERFGEICYSHTDYVWDLK
jgi:hypothetical protein